MKKISIILTLLLVIASSIFGLQSIYIARSNQTEKERNASSKTENVEIGTENLQTRIESVKATQMDKYDYVVGQKLAEALYQNCSIFFGTIQDIKSKENEQIKQVDFHIDEWLAGKNDGNENEIQLDFNSWVSKKAGPNENPLENVNLERGGKLLIVSFRATNAYKLVVSEEKLFPSIKEVVKYNSSKTNEGMLTDIPQILNTQSDFVFAGYVIQRINMFGTIGDVNGNAMILTELLGKETIPKNAWQQVRNRLNYLLLGDNDLLISTRNKIAEKLVEMGSSENKEEAEQAILLLVEISKNEKINLKQYLSEKKSAKLNQNYRTLVMTKISSEDRKNFEKQLSEN